LAGPNEKTCLIIAPIGEERSVSRTRSDSLIKLIIEPVIMALGYDPIRADQISQQGLVTNQIIRRIVNSPLVIADLTESNPNVFYELAVRHMIMRPLVHMMDERYKLPFDVANLRIIKYPALEISGESVPLLKIFEPIDKTKKELESHIKSMQNDDFKVESPISSAVGKTEISKIFAPLAKLVAQAGSRSDDQITKENVLGLKGGSTWFHVKISNIHTDEMAKDCFPLMLSIKDVGNGSIRNLSSSLKWEDTSDSKVSIPKGIEKQFDAILINHENPSKAFIGMNWYGSGFSGINIDQYTLNGPGDFELDIGVYSDNFPTMTITCTVHLGDKLDDIEFQIIKSS
jgi:hypothetical protein